MSEPDFGRTPPHDLAAEQVSLGGMLLDTDVIPDVLAALRPGDYYRPGHVAICETIFALHEAGEPADPVAVAAELTKRGEIAKIGGAPYLHTLMASVPAAVNAGYYARIVAEHAVKRRLIEAGTRIVQMGYSADAEAAEIASRAFSEVEDAAAMVSRHAVRPIRDVVYAALDEAAHGTSHGLALPWADLDALLNGASPGQLIYIAARPAIGKSLAGAGIAAHAALNLGLPALLVSMEMRAEDITLRLISAQAKVSLWALTHQQATQDDWERVARVAEPIAASPLAIDYDPWCSLVSIRTRLREMQRDGAPARVLVVDYLGLMEPPAAENRQTAIAALSRGLKRIAGEFGIPVIALAQLNRGPEMRADHRPLLADLRESGAQEQDADVVILLHREDAYDRESPRAGEIDLIVAKNRTGPTATITVAFQGHYGRIKDMSRMTEPDRDWSPSGVLEQDA
jgi:replicative DNA helicase